MSSPSSQPSSLGALYAQPRPSWRPQLPDSQASLGQQFSLWVDEDRDVRASLGSSWAKAATELGITPATASPASAATRPAAATHPSGQSTAPAGTAYDPAAAPTHTRTGTGPDHPGPPTRRSRRQAQTQAQAAQPGPSLDQSTAAATQPPEAAPDGGRASILRSSAIMAAGTLVSRLLGFLRTTLMVYLMGATTTTGNAWNTANTLPNMIYILLAGGVLNAVLVPQFTRALKHGDGGQAYTDRLLTLALSILLGITVLFTAAAPLVYAAMDTGHGTPRALGTAFAFVCLPQILFYGVYTLLGEALNARGRFGAFMWSPALANIVAIAGIVYLMVTTTPSQTADPQQWTTSMILILGGSATLGIAAQALVLVNPLRKAGYLFKPNFAFRGVGLRTASTVAIWAFGAVVLQQIALVISTNVLNSVPRGYGGSNAQAVAFLLFMLPHSLVTVSLVTALYTRLSNAAAEGRTTDVRADFDLGMRLSGLASVAVMIGSLVLILPLTRSIFSDVAGSGVSDATAIGDTTIAMMLGIVPFTMCVLEQRVFYAYEDAKTPFWMQLICTAVTIALTLAASALPVRWISTGVALGGSIGYVVQAAVGYVWLRRRMGGLPIAGVIQTYVRLALAALAASAAALVIRIASELTLGAHTRPANLVTLVVGGSVFLAVYVVGGQRLHVQEMTQLLSPVTSRLSGRRRRAA